MPGENTNLESAWSIMTNYKVSNVIKLAETYLVQKMRYT